METRERKHAQPDEEDDQLPTNEKLAEALTASFNTLVRKLTPHDAIRREEFNALANQLTRNVIRARRRRRSLYASFGRLLSQEQAAQKLRVSSNGVNRRAAEGRLVALPVLGRGYEFPEIQFDEQRPGQLIEGLPPILQALADAGPWSAAEFLVTRNRRMKGTPLHLLRRKEGDVAAITKAARIWAGHGR